MEYGGKTLHLTQGGTEISPASTWSVMCKNGKVTRAGLQNEKVAKRDLDNRRAGSGLHEH